MLTPGLSPAPIEACLARPRKVSGLTPVRCPTRITAAFNDSSGSSLSASCTSLIAHSRNSCGYFLSPGMTPSFRRISPSAKLGAIHFLGSPVDFQAEDLLALPRQVGPLRLTSGPPTHSSTVPAAPSRLIFICYCSPSPDRELHSRVFIRIYRRPVLVSHTEHSPQDRLRSTRTWPESPAQRNY